MTATESTQRSRHLPSVTDHRLAVGVIAWVLALVGLACSVTGAVLLRPYGSTLMEKVVLTLPYLAVGAFIVMRRPRNLVGWFLLLGGFSFAVHSAASGYAARGFGAGDAGLPGAVLAAWIGSWTWIPGFSFHFMGLPYVFPNGRLPSRRWRPVAWVAVSLPILQLLAVATSPGVITDFLDETGPLPGAVPPPNPFGIPAAEAWLNAVDDVVEMAFIPILLGGILALVMRYRRGDRTVRLQIRWLMLSVCGIALAFIASAAIEVPDALFAVVVGGVPVTIGLAVMRHRLYDIDRILSRAAVYVLVTAVLVAVYAAVAIVPTVLFGGIGGSDLRVAAATLAAAGAFGPVRRRVQRLVDRRFNRSRYDLARTIESFTQELRDEVDVDAVRQEMCGVVSRALQPQHAGVWVRGEEPRGGS